MAIYHQIIAKTYRSVTLKLETGFVHLGKLMKPESSVILFDCSSLAFIDFPMY